MTVEEVKTILRTAGVNLNDTQYAAIQSLLGGGDIHYTEINENNLAEIVNKAMYFQIFIKVDPHVEESKGDTKGDTKAAVQAYDAIWYYIYVVLSNGDKLACNKEYIPAFFDKQLPIITSATYRERIVTNTRELVIPEPTYYGQTTGMAFGFDENANMSLVEASGYGIPGGILYSVEYIDDNVYKYTYPDN